MSIEGEEYNVCCHSCERVFSPRIGSDLWWKAKKRAEAGYLDAHTISGEECGCVEKRFEPDSPFRVFGYDMGCVDFDIPCHTFMSAIKTALRHKRAGDVVFITGVSYHVSNMVT
jgi:hypothetical protein